MEVGRERWGERERERFCHFLCFLNCMLYELYVFLFSPVVLGVYVLFDSINVNRFLYIFKSIYLNLFFKLAKTQLKSLFCSPLYKIKNLAYFPLISDLSRPCLTSFGSTFTLTTVMTARSTEVKPRALHFSYIIRLFLFSAPGLL